MNNILLAGYAFGFLSGVLFTAIINIARKSDK